MPLIILLQWKTLYYTLSVTHPCKCITDTIYYTQLIKEKRIIVPVFFYIRPSFVSDGFIVIKNKVTEPKSTNWYLGEKKGKVASAKVFDSSLSAIGLRSSFNFLAYYSKQDISSISSTIMENMVLSKSITNKEWYCCLMRLLIN